MWVCGGSRGVMRMGRAARRLGVPVVLAALLPSWLAAGSPAARAAAPPRATFTATTTTQPSATSAASLYLSNWQNLMAIWMASKLNQNDTGNYGPRIGELHYSGNW